MSPGYTVPVPAPTPQRLFFTFLAVSFLLFLRPPNTGFVFDEQEALLANPYLLGDLPITRVFEVDFWGRAPERTIGSYRPLPNLLWRCLAFSLRFHTPWAFSFFNILAHALSATLLARLVARFLSFVERKDARRIIWFSGLCFCACALSSEAVVSIVGLADVLVGLFTLASCSFVMDLGAESHPHEILSWQSMARLSALFLCVFLGLLSKESMMASLPLLPLLYWMGRSQRGVRQRLLVGTLLMGVGALALVAYVSLRNRMFPIQASAAHPLIISGPGAEFVRAFLSWFAPPVIPSDPMNNPLVEASAAERMYTAAEVFLDQVALFFLPVHLVADFSFPRQLPSTLGLKAIGGLLLFGASLVGCVWGVFGSLREKSISPTWRLLLLGLGWTALSFFPLSNALLLLPTIRAERLFYTPAVGLSLVLASLALRFGSLPLRRQGSIALFFLVVQGVQARAHALHYSSDVSFWRATSFGDPASAKAYLNYGVMVGARAKLDARLRYTRKAVESAPKWTMARIYLADTHCRRKELDIALPLYLQALSEVPQSKSLTALSLQCIWEAGAYDDHRHELQDLAAAYPDSWLDYFVFVLGEQEPGEEGIPAKYRPRRYNARRAGE